MFDMMTDSHQDSPCPYQIPKKTFHHGLPIPFALFSYPSTKRV